MSDPMWIGVGIGDSVGTATIATDGTFTITAHGLVDGQPVRLDTLTGGAVGVFLEGTTYYVVNAAADTFDLVSTPGDTVITLGSSGGADVHTAVPHYSAPELRRADAVTLFGGTADAFGARQGVRPGHVPASVSGTTWTVEHLTAVVYPGLSSTDGPYRVQHESESASLDPADGTNDRIDALDLQIQDDDEDASGFRRARVVYVVGTPAATPAAPAVTVNSLRLATILVPSGGTPSPSVATLAVWTVASGGMLPVRDSTELPSSGTYDGMVAWLQDSGTLQVDDGTGSGWEEIARRNPPMVRLFKNANQSIPNNTLTNVTFESEDFDTHGFHTGTSAVVTPTVAGLYRVKATVAFPDGAGNFRRASIYLNDSEEIQYGRNAPISGTSTVVEVSTLLEFDGSSDNVRVKVQQDSGGSLNVLGGDRGDTVLEVEYVRPPL